VSDRDGPTLPDEHGHNYENVDEEEIRDHGGSLRVAVWVVSALIAVALIAVPVFRVIEWGDGDRDDGGASASEARAFVATRFADAAFIRRSADEALRWTLPQLRSQIDAIVDELRQRPATDFAGAAVSVAAVACDGMAGRDSGCYHAWIRRPGASDLIRVQLVVEIVNGDAIVTEIERVNVV